MSADVQMRVVDRTWMDENCFGRTVASFSTAVMMFAVISSPAICGLLLGLVGGPPRALPTETKVESGTSQSKS